MPKVETTGSFGEANIVGPFMWGCPATSFIPGIDLMKNHSMKFFSLKSLLI